jgi:hypothetical protein
MTEKVTYGLRWRGLETGRRIAQQPRAASLTVTDLPRQSSTLFTPCAELSKEARGSYDNAGIIGKRGFSFEGGEIEAPPSKR